jgi:lysozyme
MRIGPWRPKVEAKQVNSVTVFGVDLSNNNPRIDLAQVKSEGFEFVFAKASEGDYFQDATWPGYRDAGAAAGLITVPYHYAIGSCPPDSQVATFRANGGGDRVMIDFEANSGGINDFWALKAAFDAAGVAVVLSYFPRWYAQRIGSPDLSGVPNLIASSYVGGSGPASVLYPGDDSFYWAPYYGATPTVLQFSDAGLVAGARVDVNAFRGTRDELAALLGLPSTGEDMTPEQAQQLQEIWDQLRGPGGHGWRQINGRTVVDALAEVGAHLGITGYTPPTGP